MVIPNLFAPPALAMIKHSFALGLFSVFLVAALDASKRKKDTLAQVLAGLGMTCALPLVSLIVIYAAAERLMLLSAALYFLGLAIGTVGGFVGLRQFAPRFESMAAKLTKKTGMERSKKTDVREIGASLPKPGAAFLPTDNFDQAKGIFVGKGINGEAIYLPYSDFAIQHTLLTGRTRAGKGVAAQTIIPQLMERGEFCVVLDPKVDSFMPYIFKQEAERLGKPYTFIDLRQSAPAQINIFKNCNEETIENMLIGAFSLSEKGTDADFYKLGDRKAARQAAKFLANSDKTSADALAEYGKFWAEEAGAFNSYMQEMAELESVNCREANDLESMTMAGGMLYVVGDMINPRIIRMQKMILLRLLFLAKGTFEDEARPTICVFADEFKAHISRPFMVSLGASAGWRLHTILAFQSLQDLADCPADLDKDAVRGSVMENCAVQISYAVKDPDTAEWLARSTGTIQVDDESRKVTKNLALAESLDDERTIRQAERYFIDENMFQNLPKGIAVLSLPGTLSRFAQTSMIPLKKKDKSAITPVEGISGLAKETLDELAEMPAQSDDYSEF